LRLEEDLGGVRAEIREIESSQNEANAAAVAIRDAYEVSKNRMTIINNLSVTLFSPGLEFTPPLS
jgi:hypothetical protein